MHAIYLQREEIRRRILTRMGWDTSDDELTEPVSPQINGLINEAAAHIAQEAPAGGWEMSQTEAVITTSDGQRIYNYPEVDIHGRGIEVGAGGIVEAGVWDQDRQRYVPLELARIPLSCRFDPISDDVDPSNEYEQRDVPARLDQRRTVALGPVPDGEYEIMMSVVCSDQITRDDTVSTVDAEAIVLYVLAERCSLEGRETQADRHRGKLARRLTTLRRHSGNVVRVDLAAAARLKVMQIKGRAPRGEQTGTEPFIPSS